MVGNRVRLTMGNFNQRLQWNNLGSSYERYIRISVSDPVKRVVHGARCPGLYFDDVP